MLSNYEKDKFGVIKQKTISSKFVYDCNYSKQRYDSYKELSVYMSYLRYGFILGSIGKLPTSIVDVGYGNGSFLKVCSKTIKKCYGIDVSDYPIPENCEKLDSFDRHFDIVTFFDSLEHFEDISFISKIDCNYLCISVPECHYFSDEWFENWKHRRPDEHLWHFNLESLTKFMFHSGYNLINSTNLEDIIRINGFEYSNILTCIFKKQL